jgi:hypothetical protein
MAFNIAVDRYEVIVKRLQPWFDEENSHLYGEAPVRGEGVLIGCPVWGKEYIERLRSTACRRSALPQISLPWQVIVEWCPTSRRRRGRCCSGSLAGYPEPASTFSFARSPIRC